MKVEITVDELILIVYDHYFELYGGDEALTEIATASTVNDIIAKAHLQKRRKERAKELAKRFINEYPTGE